MLSEGDKVSLHRVKGQTSECRAAQGDCQIRWEHRGADPPEAPGGAELLAGGGSRWGWGWGGGVGERVAAAVHT